MATDTYVGVSGAWKKLSGMSVGVSGAWKNITNAYVGVGGVWKKFYASIQVLAYPISSAAFAVKPSSATAYVSVNSNGYLYRKTVQQEQWLIQGANSDYQVRFTRTGGDSDPTGLVLGTWYTLSSTVTATLQAPGGAGPFDPGEAGPFDSSGTYDIRRASDQTILASSTWSLHADSSQ